jgi:hypothetical protein
MPRYEVSSLDVWGNAVDGYDVNNQFREGTLLIRPGAGDADLVKALVDNGYLNRAAIGAFVTGDLEVGDNVDFLEISEPDPTFSAVDENGEARYLDANTRAQAEAQLQDGEQVEDVQGMRPVLHLELIQGESGAKPFLVKLFTYDQLYRALHEPRGWYPKSAVVELRAVPGKASSKDLLVESWVNGDYYNELELGGLEGAELGIDPNGSVIKGWTDINSQARVAMDAFLERGGVGLPTFVQIPGVEALGKAIRKNTDDYFDQTISHEEFGRRNRAIWDKASAEGLNALVQEWLNENPTRESPEAAARRRRHD